MDSVTIDEIVSAADVAKGSFYNHFDDKDALGEAVHDLVRRDAEAQIADANHDILDPPLRIARALCTVIRYAKEHPERVQALMSLSSRGAVDRSPLNSGLSSDVSNGIQARRLRPIGVETGMLIVMGIANIAVQHALSSQQHAVEALASAMGTAILLALGVDGVEAEEIGRTAAAEILGSQDQSASVGV